jgi:ABC-type polysaccharide/polyol phosphate transport system ATPase subunit
MKYANMTNYAIRAEGLSKQYTIGASKQRYYTLREALIRGMTAPFKRLWNGPGSSAAADMIWALKDLSFQIKRGEVVGIIGRNGAGKSTLLKILSRIVMPSEGRVVVRGRVASLLEVGTGFHPELTGRENVFLNGAILGMTRGEVRQKFDEMVSFADVERFIDTPVKHYSSGMYMRLAFAVAAHLETDILVVDEVLAVGDASFQKKCLAKMENVAGQGRTVLFVSHNMSAMQSLCGRVIHLADGQIKADGEPHHVINDYLSSAIVNQTKHKRLKVGDAFTLMNMSVSPNPVESGKDVRFQFDLVANHLVQLNEAVLVLFALEGARVGMVDLRPAGLPIEMRTGDCVRIEALVRSIPLVDHQYRVAFWVDYGVSASVVDVADLTVVPIQANALYAPYGPQARGLVEFKTECSVQQYREHSLMPTG